MVFLTVIISNLNILRKASKAFGLSLSLLLLISIAGNTQQLELIDSMAISTPTRASIDRLNNIYIVDEKGNVNKYDKEGNITLQYSPQQLAEVTLLEAWNPLKVFVFYQDFQEYLFLDRFLTTTSRFSTRGLGNYIGMATISADNNIWFIDYSDFSLKKYDVNLDQLILSTPLSFTLNQDVYDIKFMREYQNLLFVSDHKSGIFIFDNLGNYLRKINLSEVGYFSFNQNQLCSTSENNVIITDIYTSKSRYFTLKEKVLFAFSQDEYLTVLTESQLKRYKISVSSD